MAAKKRTFEQAMDSLEDIVAHMERPGVGLEECLKLYKEGIELALFCGERLNAVEQEVTVLMKTANGCLEQPLDNGDDINGNNVNGDDINGNNVSGDDVSGDDV